MTEEIILEDQTVLKDIHGVIAAGCWYPRQMLDQMTLLEK